MRQQLLAMGDLKVAPLHRVALDPVRIGEFVGDSAGVSEQVKEGLAGVRLAACFELTG